MKNLLTAKQSGNILLFLFSLMILFHIVVLLGFVPINMVWGGRVETRGELFYFELFSITVTVIAMVTVSLRVSYINWPRLMGVAKIVMWILFVLFVLNTIGNAFAATDIERYAGGAGTLLLSFLSWRVAVEK